MSLPTKTLGKTNRKVTIFGLGGEGILRTRGYEKEAESVIKKAVEVGVTYFDTAPAYEQSRDYLGYSLWKYTKRENIFLASKTHDRTYQGTMFLIEDSLKRLKTNYLDLIQLHDLRTNEDLEEIFSPNGAIHAVEEARKKGMGIIAMKVTAQVHALSTISMKEAIYYTLSLDVDLAIIGCRTPQEIEENAELVKNFKPLTKEELLQIEGKTKSRVLDTNFFKKGMY